MKMMFISSNGLIAVGNRLWLLEDLTSRPLIDPRTQWTSHLMHWQDRKAVVTEFGAIWTLVYCNFGKTILNYFKQELHDSTRLSQMPAETLFHFRTVSLASYWVWWEPLLTHLFLCDKPQQLGHGALRDSKRFRNQQRFRKAKRLYRRSLHMSYHNGYVNMIKDTSPARSRELGPQNSLTNSVWWKAYWILFSLKYAQVIPVIFSPGLNPTHVLDKFSPKISTTY